jgi:hypothetical protein
MKPRNIKQLQAESRKLQAHWLDSDTVIVESRSDPDHCHAITFTFDGDDQVYAHCTCEWSQNHGVACSHVMAAMEHLAELKGRTLSFWLTMEDAKRQKSRTFYLARRQDDNNGVWITSRAG